MIKTLVILSIGAILLSAAADCNNPLLGRSEIIARYGGSANILSAPATASNDIATCSFLKGKQTCVNSAGYTALKASFDALKDDFVAKGAAENKARYGNLSSMMDVNTGDCVDNSIAFITFIFMGAFGGLGSGMSGSGSVSGGANVDWSQIVPAIKAQIEAQRQELNIDEQLDILDDVRANVTKDKANCAKHLMSIWLYASCEASDADYSAKVGGSVSDPILRVKRGFCSDAARDCRNYFSSMKIIGEAHMIFALCSNDLVEEIGDLILRTDYSAATGTRLNEILNSLLTGTNQEILNLAGNMEGGAGADIHCSNVEPGANDCNFICDRVVNATGFNANRFHRLDRNANARILQNSGSLQESDDPNVDSVSTAMSQEDTTVEEEGEIGSGLRLFVNLGLLLLASLYFL